MKRPKISIIIIHYNTPHYLRTCLDAIFKQTYPNIEVIFIDNDSPNKAGLELVQKEYGERGNIVVVANRENLGYAKAANQGIRMAIECKNPADYVVITNPDIIYSPSYFEKIVHRVEKSPEVAAITGKVYKYDFEVGRPTKVIDTAGLFAYRNRRIIDDGQGIEDTGQFDTEREVFGVSGACPLYRREALEAVRLKDAAAGIDEYMDEDFFMYKEDVDLSWRFILYGWKCLYYPRAVAFHGRGTGIHKRFTTGEILRNRGKLSRFQKHYSFRNQLLMQTKNETVGGFLRHFPAIMMRKVLTAGYITVREPFLWKSYIEYLGHLPRILKKRRMIMKGKKISGGEMAGYFGKQSGYR